MVSYRVDFTSVYTFTIGKFILLCLQVFIILVLLFKEKVIFVSFIFLV